MTHDLEPGVLYEFSQGIRHSQCFVNLIIRIVVGKSQMNNPVISAEGGRRVAFVFVCSLARH
jgi:hypothetical protein